MSTFALIALFTAFLTAPAPSHQDQNSWIGDDTYSTWAECYKNRFINGKLELTCYQQCYCFGYDVGICAEKVLNRGTRKYKCQCSGGTHDWRPEYKPPKWCGFNFTVEA